MPLSFRKFFIRHIDQWAKSFCKKPVDRAGQKFTGRVEKILTGSISSTSCAVAKPNEVKEP